jgi:hypothetical protein
MDIITAYADALTSPVFLTAPLWAQFIFATPGIMFIATFIGGPLIWIGHVIDHARHKAMIERRARESLSAYPTA